MRCVLVSDRLDLRAFLGGEVARIAGRVDVVDNSDQETGADIPLALAWNPPKEAFERYPRLQAVCSLGAGVDSILTCPSLRPGVDVVRVVDPDQALMMAGFVAFHVIGHQRSFAAYRQQQRDRIWRPLKQRPARDVPVGILGYGEMGRRAAALLAGLGFPVMAWSRSAKPTAPPVRGFHGRNGLDAMLGETEVLVNLLPLTRETQGILHSGVFDRMRRGGYLVQVARGEHLVEGDLLAALERGQLAGAALDVFADEPLPRMHPFWSHPNIAVTPHDACDASAAAVAATLVATANAIRTGVRPPNTVDRSRGY